jgi:predicted RNase H-like HicB family nuclease
MNALLRTKAEQIASRLYPYLVVRDITTDGESVYIASCLDFEGCIGQGLTPEEAKEDLQAARIDYIYSLLEDGLLVSADEIPQTDITTEKHTVDITPNRQLDANEPSLFIREVVLA